MKMKNYLLVAAITGCVICAGCGGKTAATSSADSTAKATSESSVEIPNPMEEYQSVQEITDKIGYQPAVLPESTGFAMEQCYIVDETLVDLRYTNKENNSEATVRTQKNCDYDINGYQGAEYTESVVYADVTYKVAEVAMEDGTTAYAAYYTDGDMTYGMSMTGAEKAVFTECFNSLIDANTAS